MECQDELRRNQRKKSKRALLLCCCSSTDTICNGHGLHNSFAIRGTASRRQHQYGIIAPPEVPSTPPRHAVQPAEVVVAAVAAEEEPLVVLPVRPSSPRSYRIPSPSLPSGAGLGAAQVRNGSRSVSCCQIDELGRHRSSWRTQSNSRGGGEGEGEGGDFSYTRTGGRTGASLCGHRWGSHELRGRQAATVPAWRQLHQPEPIWWNRFVIDIDRDVKTVDRLDNSPAPRNLLWSVTRLYTQWTAGSCNTKHRGTTLTRRMVPLEAPKLRASKLACQR